ncbi:MAG TPA: Asp-tRNA(Asn)/Glu-tRNA(Gln) amidotransferase subunit GatC [Candidatus Moranbacteria bacterium]|nr:Asp-tRNA(Asn)/Glu-tRNA(Gln) amidotransferase subunit GatC [Candidatus Moranbacteria bacterium]
MLTKEEVVHIANLARIGINEEEAEKYRQEISAVLDYFSKLNEVETEGVEPIGHITGMENVLREDRNEDFGSLGREAILANVPEVKDGYVKVKSVL